MTTNFNNLPAWLITTALILLAWSLIWKGFALYRAGRLKQPLWFVVLFLVNTLGILEIFYILVFSKMTKVSAPTEAEIEEGYKKLGRADSDPHPMTEPHIIKGHD
jgi:hypothetical protein